MDNLQEKQDNAILFLEWINDNIKEWHNIESLVTGDFTHEQCLATIEKLIDSSLYSMAIFILLTCVNDYVTGQAIERWVNKKVIDEIKTKGIKTVWAEFVEIAKNVKQEAF